jgi:endonuclease G
MFNLFFGIFRGIASILTRNKGIQTLLAWILMLGTLVFLLGLFFYYNPKLTPKPIAQLMKEAEAFLAEDTHSDPHQDHQRQEPSHPDTPQNPDTDHADTEDTGNPEDNQPKASNTDFEKKKNFMLPHYKAAGQLVVHKGYTLYYIEKYEQALFVAYELKAEYTRGTADRGDDTFHPDPEVETGSAIPDDYRGSGYDRGHLAPAADFKYSEQRMADSFFMSNMSPQAPELNRGIWRVLEEQVRKWAQQEKKVYIVTGPLLKPGLKTIGRRNKIAVPEAYYKVILDLSPPQPKAIGFILPNQGAEESSEALKQFVVSVDEVEKQTGLDFWPMLPDEMEKSLEAKSNVNAWTWQKAKKLRR